MEVEGDEEIDIILQNHKEFLDDPKLRNEEEIFNLMKKITNAHDSKYYYNNVKILLPQVWKTFTKEQKNYLAQCITNFFSMYSKYLQTIKEKTNSEFESFPNELLEIFQTLEPQIVMEPELYSKIATKNNCWVNCILMLENQLKVIPDSDKYNLILSDLYSALEQDDYYLSKNNTVVVDKAVTFSQFRMWEEVNEELNKALLDLYSSDSHSIDLAYANEYDQKIWEEIHSESIVQIGDLDRQKFFSQGMNKYGKFKSEFQKWMVIGKNHQKFACFENSREKLCQEWCSLPKFIDQVHYNKLTKFQESIELNESMALLHSSRGEPKEKYLKDFSTAAMIQRDRIPVKCESHRVCKDILENRYIPFNLLNSAVENRNRQGEQNDPTNKNKFAFKRLLNYIWVRKSC